MNGMARVIGLATLALALASATLLFAALPGCDQASDAPDARPPQTFDAAVDAAPPDAPEPDAPAADAAPDA